MASSANHLSFSLSSELAPHSSLHRANSSELFLRFQNSPAPSSLRSSFVSPVKIELNRVGVSALKASRIGSRISASSTPVMDQSPSQTSSRVPTIVEVDLGNRSYPIYIGSGLLQQPELLQRYLNFILFKFWLMPMYVMRLCSSGICAL